MRDRSPQPLFRLDVGWLYLLSGLMLIAAATVIPARGDLASVDSQLAELHAKEQYCRDRLTAYIAFLEEWEQPDNEMLIRLASAQLNQRPEGDRPVVLADNVSTALTDWIDGSVHYVLPPPTVEPASMLNRATTGRGQLWVLAAGALAVFVGLLLGPGSSAGVIFHEQEDDVVLIAAERQDVGLAANRMPTTFVDVESTAANCPSDVCLETPDDIEVVVMADDEMISTWDEQNALQDNCDDSPAPSSDSRLDLPHDKDADGCQLEVVEPCDERAVADVSDPMHPTVADEYGAVDVAAAEENADDEEDGEGEEEDDEEWEEDDDEWEDEDGEDDEEWEDEDEVEDEDDDAVEDDDEEYEEEEDEEWEDEDEDED